MVARLLALYGLHCPPLLWHKLLSSALRSPGLKSVSGEPCLFYNYRPFVFFYVADSCSLLDRYVD